MSRHVLFAAVLILAACNAKSPLPDMQPGETGRVVRVIDGDALVLDTGQSVRLVSIEAPALYPRDRTTRSMSSTVETVAVRGEEFALVRWSAISGRGREWEALHLARWNADGLNVLNVIFPTDQLNEALAELDSLYEAARGGG